MLDRFSLSVLEFIQIGEYTMPSHLLHRFNHDISAISSAIETLANCRYIESTKNGIPCICRFMLTNDEINPLFYRITDSGKNYLKTL